MTMPNPSQPASHRRFDHVELFVLGLCTAIVVVSLGLFGATGARMFTRFPNADLEQANESSEIDDLFAEAGLNEEHGEMERVKSEFTFGLLPSGPGKVTLSVMATAGPALVVGPLFILARRRMHKGRSAAAAPANSDSTPSARAERSSAA